MLRLAGYINILIAIGHMIGLLWAPQMFEVTGIGKEMEQLSQIHFSLPHILTVLVAAIFFMFGLYGLAAADTWTTLPFLKPAIFIIASIYIFRGLGQLAMDIIQKTNSIIETIYSLSALMIGLLFLIGGVRKWKTNFR